MARYTGPVCRQCRRAGVRLYLKGERCFPRKCEMEKRAYAPGEQHTDSRPASSIRLTACSCAEKQKLRRIYGVLERQFRLYFAEAERRPGITGETLLQLLERRLDNVVYRLGLATSRRTARQLVGARPRDGERQTGGRPVLPDSHGRHRLDRREEPDDGPSSCRPWSKAGSRRLPVWLQIGRRTPCGAACSRCRRGRRSTPRFRKSWWSSSIPGSLRQREQGEESDDYRHINTSHRAAGRWQGSALRLLPGRTA